jgi:hypothetical protein
MALDDKLPVIFRIGGLFPARHSGSKITQSKFERIRPAKGVLFRKTRGQNQGNEAAKNIICYLRYIYLVDNL